MNKKQLEERLKNLECEMKEIKSEFEGNVSMGDRYLEGDYGHGGEFILAQTAPKMVCFISLSNGNRWVQPIKVKDSKNISMLEFIRMQGSSGKFVKKDE